MQFTRFISSSSSSLPLDCRFVKLHGGWQVKCESSTALFFSLNHFRLLENTPQFANNAWQNNTHAHILPPLAKLFKGYENKTIRNNGFPNTVPPPCFLFLFNDKKRNGRRQGPSRRNQWLTDVDPTNQVSRIHWKPLAGYKGSCLVSGRWKAIILSFYHS